MSKPDGLLGGLVIGLVMICQVSAQTITFTQLSTTFSNPIGVDYHEPTDSLILSANYPSGSPLNLERIDFDGTHVPFSNLAGPTNELKIATVRSIANPGGFVVGDVFTGNGVDGEIVRITDGGATVINPWVSLPGLGNGLMRGGLYIDRTGVFGGDLIVCTNAGEVWRIDNSGSPSFLVDLNVHLEGLATVPNDPSKYGPLAGTIIAGAEEQGLTWSIDAAGNATSYAFGVNIEDIDVIPANDGFFGINFGTGQLLGAPANDFAGMAGDLLLTQEMHSGVGLYHLRWDGAAFQVDQFLLGPGSATPQHWEQVTFAPVAIVPFPSCDIVPSGSFTATVGVALSFTITGVDANPQEMVTLSTTGLPLGAQTVPALPAQGNPVTVAFTWTPTDADIGGHSVVFSASDSTTLVSNCAANILVASAWTDQGSALAGISGDPMLTGSEPLSSGSLNSVDLSTAASGAWCNCFVALSSTPVAFKGGTLNPFPFVLPPLVARTDAIGSIPLLFRMPPNLPSGTELWVQWAIKDAAAINGVALSNAIKGVTP